jgi:thiamine-phosphate pyrophosphorylase
LNLPGLYAVVDAEVASAHGWALVDLAAAVLDGGAMLVQVRGNALSSAELLQVSRRIVALAAPYRAAVVVNDRADLAMLAGAAGVHLGQDDLSPADARAIVGRDALVGVSTHSTDQIAAAPRAAVSYIAVGPVFGTTTKHTGYEAVGLDLVRHAAAGGSDVVAIGGVTLERVGQVFAAGATSVAVITDLLTGGDPAARTRAFVDAAEAARAAL